MSRFGAGVLAWVDGLPERIERLSRRWDLTVVRPLGGNTSHTLYCHRGGTTPVVLKLVPELELLAEEYAALTAWADSPVVVRVLEVDLAEGALLLEGLVPGTAARGAGGDQVVALLSGLHRPAPAGFRPLAERVDFMFALLQRRRPGYYDRAHSAALALADDPVPPVLLHGDLHAENVLDAGPRGLVVIDPRPCAGDPAFDAVDFAFDGGDPHARVRELSEVVDPERLLAWCRALSVFSPAWQRIIHPGER
ncbi:MAG TPA: aminoglycoside phosphotransferase family protein [Umezawaea sp.]|nr:aminoglycoside phosphotransferase family protein [Umezawaea sp.]